MNERCYNIVRTFELSLPELVRPFAMARIILLARVRPCEISSAADDPDLEERLHAAIKLLQQEMTRGRPPL